MKKLLITIALITSSVLLMGQSWDTYYTYLTNSSILSRDSVQILAIDAEKDSTFIILFADFEEIFETQLVNSAGLAGALSDETGTGVAVFGTSPTFTTGITIGSATITEADAGYLDDVDAAIDQSSLDARYELQLTNEAGLYSALSDVTQFVEAGDSPTLLDGTANTVLYIDGSGDVTELALGSSGTYLQSQGDGSAPTWSTPAGSGDVSKVGTPVDNQVGVWTGDGTLEGDVDLTFDGDNLTVDGTVTGTGFIIGSANINETELEVIDGATLTTTELNYVDGVTSAIQTQLDAKLDASDTVEVTYGYGLDTSWTSSNAMTLTVDTTNEIATINDLSAKQDALTDEASLYTALSDVTQFVEAGDAATLLDGTAYRVFYTDASGDVTELALGADGTYLRSNGASAVPSFTTPAGGSSDSSWTSVNFIPISSPPSTAEGDVYYDSDTDLLLMYDGSQWDTLNTAGGSGLSSAQVHLLTDTIPKYTFMAGTGAAGDTSYFASGADDFGMFYHTKDTLECLVRLNYMSASDSMKFNIYWGNYQSDTKSDSLFDAPEAVGTNQRGYLTVDDPKIPPAQDVWMETSGTQIPGSKPIKAIVQLDQKAIIRD